MSLLKNEKETQLNNFTSLVTGIRLFNRYLEKGGMTIENGFEMAYINST
jgi:hypothetical protein